MVSCRISVDPSRGKKQEWTGRRVDLATLSSRFVVSAVYVDRVALVLEAEEKPSCTCSVLSKSAGGACSAPAAHSRAEVSTLSAPLNGRDQAEPSRPNVTSLSHIGQSRIDQMKSKAHVGSAAELVPLPSVGRRIDRRASQGERVPLFRRAGPCTCLDSASIVGLCGWRVELNEARLKAAAPSRS